MSDDILKEFLQYRFDLFGFIMSLVRSNTEAEDIFQEVAAAVVKKSAAPPDEIRDFRAWARSVAHHQVMKHFRDNPAKKTVFLPVQEMENVAEKAYAQNPLSLDELSAEHHALRACLGKMPERARDLLNLRFVLEHGYDEIARALETTETAVRRAVSRGRLALLECVRRRLNLTEQGI